jgi:two-component system chemotaxis response regulator CheB
VPFDIAVVGTSLGGLHALRILLGGLPKRLPLAIAIVQHRGRDPGGELREILQRHSALSIVEPEDKETIAAGTVYIAPAGYHLLVERGAFALSTDVPVWHARPSIDVLFESAADAYTERAIGVILTGSSPDGARGLARIKERGGLAIVENPATAESRVLPDAAIAAAQVDRILPLSEIAPFLASLSHATTR